MSKQKNINNLCFTAETKGGVGKTITLNTQKTRIEVEINRGVCHGYKRKT